jgi:hypothetical protein
MQRHPYWLRYELRVLRAAWKSTAESWKAAVATVTRAVVTAGVAGALIGVGVVGQTLFRAAGAVALLLGIFVVNLF